MGSETKIQWCHATFNHVRGCTKVSAGCARCYADSQAKRNPGTLGVWGPNGTRVVASEAGDAGWSAPLKWNAAAKAAGERRRVFCASMADVFEDWQGPMKFADFFDTEACICHECGAWMSYQQRDCTPGCKCDRAPRRLTMDDVRHRLFYLIDQTPNLDWLLLTKRPENVARMAPGYFDSAEDCPPGAERRAFAGRVVELPRNVWLGTSVENQAAADERLPHLRKIPAAVRFLSCEPLLGPIEFSNATRRSDSAEVLGKPALDGIDWVIVGGESGPGARPCRVEWIRDIVQQCRAAGVPVFVKQLGASPASGPDGDWTLKIIDRKGGDPAEWPEDLRVRDFPTRS